MHTYASEADFRAFMVDGSSLADDLPIRARLEAASRTVELFCNRSRFGSGFGPRVAANRYTGEAGSTTLWLNDDYSSITDVRVKLVPDGTETTYLPETTFYLMPFDRLPARAIITVPSASMVMGSGLRGITVNGTAGYSNERRTLSATIAACLAADVTLTPSAIAEFSAGQTLWLETEMVYVRTVGTTTITVDRGANGTTAANHGTITAGTPTTYSAVAVALVTYLSSFVDATLTIAARRWRRRDINQPAAFGDSGQGMVLDPSERTLLRGIVGHLRCIATEHGLAEVAGTRG